jgi:hypothetical protein
MIFLNFVVDTERVVDFQMKEPFATLPKTRNVLNGRPGEAPPRGSVGSGRSPRSSDAARRFPPGATVPAGRPAAGAVVLPASAPHHTDR